MKCWLQGDPDSISDGTVSDTDEEEEAGEAADSTKHMRVDLDLTGRGESQALGTAAMWEGTYQGWPGLQKQSSPLASVHFSGIITCCHYDWSSCAGTVHCWQVAQSLHSRRRVVRRAHARALHVTVVF